MEEKFCDANINLISIEEELSNRIHGVDSKLSCKIESLMADVAKDRISTSNNKIAIDSLLERVCDIELSIKLLWLAYISTLCLDIGIALKISGIL